MFIVTKRSGRNESRLKEFSKEAEAVQFIFEKIREDRSYKMSSTYGLYEGADLIREYTHSDVPEDEDQGGGRQQGSSKGFAPTPFNTAPRPTSIPHSWVKNEESDDEKGDK